MDIYLLKVNNKMAAAICKICSKLAIKTVEKCQWRMNEKVQIGRMFEIITQQVITCSKAIETVAYKKYIES